MRVGVGQLFLLIVFLKPNHRLGLIADTTADKILLRSLSDFV